MKFTDVILKKRNGEILSDAEINYAVSGYVNGIIPDYQYAALLMAIYFKGLTKEETLALTKAMVHSGEMVDLSSISGVKVDKHSTGGVGDKTTLVVAPLVAAAGVKVAKLSGRGLGHTGGTVDKLESITGFTVEMTQKQFIQNVNDIGIAIGSQTKDLVPADKKIYALRDMTGTVDNISLIASSIMSKKLALGADCIVLDVKTGDGAFMKTPEEAFRLAQEMVDIGKGAGKKTVAIVTDMNEPLGNAIGNAVEVKEAIDTLKGKGPKDLTTLCLELGAHILIAANLYRKKQEAISHLEECINSGLAFSKFKEFIGAQGGDVSQIEDPSKLPRSRYNVTIHAPQDGYIQHINAMKVGIASVTIGAGRAAREEAIDHGAGIYLKKKAGDFVEKDEMIAMLFSNNVTKLCSIQNEFLSAYSFSKTKGESNPLIYGTVTNAHIELEEIHLIN